MIQKVVKWLGVIVIVAGIMRMGMTPAALIWGSDSHQELLCAYIADLLMAIGAIALYLPQMKQTGMLGFAAVFITAIGNIIISGEQYGIWAYGAYAEKGLFVNITGMFIGIGMMLGTILLAVVTFRAKVFPLWNVLLFVVMLVSFGIPGLESWFAFFWGLAYGAMGYTIVTGNYRDKEAAASLNFA